MVVLVAMDSGGSDINVGGHNTCGCVDSNFDNGGYDMTVDCSDICGCGVSCMDIGIRSMNVGCGDMCSCGDLCGCSGSHMDTSGSGMLFGYSDMVSGGCDMHGVAVCFMGGFRGDRMSLSENCCQASPNKFCPTSSAWLKKS